MSAYAPHTGQQRSRRPTTPGHRRRDVRGRESAPHEVTAGHLLLIVAVVSVLPLFLPIGTALAVEAVALVLVALIALVEL